MRHIRSRGKSALTFHLFNIYISIIRIVLVILEPIIFEAFLASRLEIIKFIQNVYSCALLKIWILLFHLDFINFPMIISHRNSAWFYFPIATRICFTSSSFSFDLEFLPEEENEKGRMKREVKKITPVSAGRHDGDGVKTRRKRDETTFPANGRA